MASTSSVIAGLPHRLRHRRVAHRSGRAHRRLSTGWPAMSSSQAGDLPSADRAAGVIRRRRRAKGFGATSCRPEGCWRGAGDAEAVEVAVEVVMTSTPVSSDARPADVLVVFGITGDLAKVMTFRSLYRLEARGLLACPVVGVAADDWGLDRLIERARSSIEATGELDEAVFDRFAAKLFYVSGAFHDPAPYEGVGEAVKGAETPVFYLEIPPFLFGRVVKGLSEAGLTTGA